MAFWVLSPVTGLVEMSDWSSEMKQVSLPMGVVLSMVTPIMLSRTGASAVHGGYTAILRRSLFDTEMLVLHAPVRAALIKQHPWLAEVDHTKMDRRKDDSGVSTESALKFIADYEAKYGMHLVIKLPLEGVK